MLKYCAFVFSLTVLLLTAKVASADLLPGIPTPDGINASVQLGTIWSPKPYSTVPKTHLEDFDLWGWGVESEFDLPTPKGWDATLALGYNQLNLTAEIDKGRRLRGTLRDLPSLSFYFGRATRNPYFGLTIAVSELVNGRLYRSPDPGTDDPGPIKVSASSFSAGLALGYESGPFFVEIGYIGRFFPSVAYDGIPTTSPFPTDLGERMYAGGFMVRIGGVLRLQKPARPKSTLACGDSKTEISGREFKVACADGKLTVDIDKDKPATPAPAPAPVPAPAPPAAISAPGAY